MVILHFMSELSIRSQFANSYVMLGGIYLGAVGTLLVIVNPIRRPFLIGLAGASIALFSIALRLVTALPTYFGTGLKNPAAMTLLAIGATAVLIFVCSSARISWTVSKVAVASRGDSSAPRRRVGPIELDLIIPVYNEEETIAEVIKRGMGIALGNLNGAIRLVVVDDASSDRTADIVKAFPNVTLIRHDHNQGKGAAVRTGLNNSSGEIVAILDADLEYYPEDIPHLVDPLVDGDADMVLGSRFGGGTPIGMRLSHLIGNMFLTLATRLLFRTSITDVMTGHKAFRRRALESLKIEKTGFDFETEVVAKALMKHLRISEVPIRYNSRRKGKAKINWFDGVRSLITLARCRLTITGRAQAPDFSRGVRELKADLL
jgi:hypothetical protein